MTGFPFTDPFRYVPHPLVRKAAREVVEKLDMMISEGKVSEDVAKGFSDGKMLGILVCEEGYLAAFSGSVGGQSMVDGFVPPIFDLTGHDGYYRKHEAEISSVNEQIRALTASELDLSKEQLTRLIKKRDEDIASLWALKHDTIAESQFRNAEIKRAKDRWKVEISGQESKIKAIADKISILKKDRARKSDELQRWIFGQYIVCNAEGSKASILEIFNKKGLMPPGGTGDCAAPKLLNHAFLHGMKPIAMGEFWYGKSPATAVRTHGHFYPSCTSKCGPLLSFMLRGTDVIGWGHMERTCPPRLWGACRTTGGGPWNVPHPMTADHIPTPKVIYEDDAIIAAGKPSGMPSVPGLDGRVSLQELLQKDLQTTVISVHRLDMDTSGIIVFAKNHQAEACLKKQFEDHTVRKTYLARLCPPDSHRFCHEAPHLKPGDKGKIELPLSPDYDERPRQKADLTQGKTASTEYEVLTVNGDGTTDILFHPHTGRTHQLRVHSAHILGLGRPILGDLLYGGCGSIWTEDQEYSRLHLHAHSITFRHPSTDSPLTLTY